MLGSDPASEGVILCHPSSAGTGDGSGLQRGGTEVGVVWRQVGSYLGLDTAQKLSLQNSLNSSSKIYLIR